MESLHKFDPSHTTRSQFGVLAPPLKTNLPVANFDFATVLQSQSGLLQHSRPSNISELIGYRSRHKYDKKEEKENEHSKNLDHQPSVVCDRLKIPEKNSTSDYNTI